MYNDELDMILNDDYFDESYDYDEANEVTLGAVILTAATIASIARLIKSLMTGLKRGDIVNIENMVKNGMSRKDATAKANKTIKFLESKGFITRETAKSNGGVIRYSDLTDEGKVFYEEFCRTVKHKSSELNFDKITSEKLSNKKFKDIGGIAASVLEIVLGILGFVVGSNFGVVVGYVIIMSGSFNLGYGLGKLINAKFFKENLPDDAIEEYNMCDDGFDIILEDAYENGYYQALADMGYEFDDAEEDVDIFDEDCYDDAMEGNPENKAKKNAFIKSQSSMNSVYHDDRMREGRSRNYVRQVAGGLSSKPSDECDRRRSVIMQNRADGYLNARKYGNTGRGSLGRFAKAASDSLHMTDVQRQKYLNSMNR